MLPTTSRGDEARAQVLLTGSRGEIAVTVEIARTPAAITRGLMHREFLGADSGMLFLMPSQEVQRFWMRNTLIALDMLFIDEDMTVVGVVERAQPRTDTSRFVDKPSRYVLEVNGGWTAAKGIGAGAKVKFVGVSLPQGSGQ